VIVFKQTVLGAAIVALVSTLCARAQELPRDWKRQLIHNGAANLELYTRGKGPPILMHPGGGGSAWQLKELGTRVSDAGFMVVLINPRGIGASTGRLDDITLHDLASDVWACADGLSLTKVHLLGRAFGNRVVRTASSDQPNRVFSLTLLAAGGEIAPAPEDSRNLNRMFDTTLDTKERLTALREATYAPGHQPDPSYLQHLNGETYKKQTEAFRRTGLKEWYLGGVAPMLVVQCLADRIAVPLNAWNLAVERANTRLVALPGCGHAMIPEQLEAISRSVIGFLQEAGSKPVTTPFKP
jgi:pimeloyl-ACP methyl ester carboxylesterase